MNPWLLTILAAMLVVGCATPHPPSGASSAAGIKWDQNQQDAGIKFFGGVGYASQGYHDNYLAWYPKFGAQAEAPADPFTPLTIEDKERAVVSGMLASDAPHFVFTVTAEGAQAYEAMNRAHKGAVK